MKANSLAYPGRSNPALKRTRNGWPGLRALPSSSAPLRSAYLDVTVKAL
jgi:hypothetical protein